MEPLAETSDEGISVGFPFGFTSISLFSFSYCAAAANICMFGRDVIIGTDAVSLSSPDRGVVSRGQECEKSLRVSFIDSEMAGPISVKLSGIDRGNSVHVLGQKK